MHGTSFRPYEPTNPWISFVVIISFVFLGSINVFPFQLSEHRVEIIVKLLLIDAAYSKSLFQSRLNPYQVL